jgi:hypothetical protein
MVIADQQSWSSELSQRGDQIGLPRTLGITNAESHREENSMLANGTAKKLMATTAVGVFGMMLVAVPASAQGQVRGAGRGGVQANESVRGGADMRGSVNSRVSADTRGSVNTRGPVDMRGTRAEQGPRAGADARVRVRAATRSDASSRGDVRDRANVNANSRTLIRSDRRHVRNDNVRYRDGGARVRVGIGYADPYYSYGSYNDGYYAYGAAEPYAQYERPYRGYSESYYSYAASPGCTCSPAPYAAWDRGDRWHRGGIGIGFTAW